jgi:FkbM family methyltransferase
MLRNALKIARRSGPTRMIIDRLIAEKRFWKDRKQLQQWSRRDEDLAAFYSQFVTPGDIVFDVGANVGNRTKIFARLQARVIAFEPQPYCIAVLEAGFGNQTNVTVVPNALGASSGAAEMFVCDSNTISSLSSDWIEAVRKSGRFADKEWNARTPINVITLDRARKIYGDPSFVKIDVEGFEAEVLKGLSVPVPALSFEFTPESLESALECLDRLKQLGPYRFNFSPGESLQMQARDWVEAKTMRELLIDAYGSDWGDLYARLDVRQG